MARLPLIIRPASSLKTILIKYPISIRSCKPERLISHRLYPFRASATLEMKNPISLLSYFTGLQWFLVVTLSSGCFHFGVCPSGGLHGFSCSLLFRKKGFLLWLSMTTIGVSGQIYCSSLSLFYLLCWKPSSQVAGENLQWLLADQIEGI